MRELPAGWIEVDLEDALAPLEDGRTIHQGWSPQCEKEPSDNDDVWGVLKTTAIQSGAFLSEHNKRLPDTLTPRPLLEVRRGDVLITCAGPRARCGVTCLVRGTRPRLMLSGKMYRFRFDDRFIDPRYVEAYLLSNTAVLAIDRMKTGGSDSGLNLTHERFRKLLFPLPPRAEQQRIVAAIEEQFSRLDAAERLLRISKRRLDKLRGAALALAVGDGHWPQRPLGELAAETLIGLDRARSRQSLDPEAGSPYIRMGNISPEGHMNWDNITYVETTKSEQERFSLSEGDLLFNTRNSRELVGKTGLVRRPPKGAVFNNNLMRIRLRPEVEPGFIWGVMNSPQFRATLDSVKNATTNVAAIYAKNLFPLGVPVPPHDEQRRIVAEVERQLSLADSLGAAIAQALKRSAALRRSILERAFTGKLVPQDPSDEPTSVLLERIAAARVTFAGSQRRRRAARSRQ